MELLAIMSSIFETDSKADQLADTAVLRTKELMDQSDKLRDRREKANRKRVARLFKDPKAIEAKARSDFILMKEPSTTTMIIKKTNTEKNLENIDNSGVE